MIIRKATRLDIPAIVDLLKLSVGESLMPKSEAFWKWKHLDNPFGESEVLVAEENEKIVGVRAFLKWEWKQGGKNIKSLRAVDTGTHPQYQGRGIFKSLNTQLVSENQARVDFVFNTPNKKTEAGNIKLGWFRYKKMPIRIKPYPLNLLRRRAASTDVLKEFAISKVLSEVLLDQLLSRQSTDNAWISDRTVQYLKWRYADIPGLSYYAIFDPQHKSYLAVFRIKVSGRGFSELRLCDILYSEAFNRRSFFDQLNRVVELIKPAYVSVAAHAGKVISGSFFLPPLPIGPQVTIRSMNRQISTDMLNQHWRPSIGDMEIF